jgi:hypothetical protein
VDGDRSDAVAGDAGDVALFERLDVDEHDVVT